MRALMVVGLLLIGAGPARAAWPPLETAPKVDLSRYMGQWYEIASFPQRFQRGCTGTVARYSLRSDGNVEVLNSCRKGSLDGKEDIARGRARVVDPSTNAKLEVSFFWPFWGDYWILELGEDYEYAVVGHPNRKYLWILSRTPQMEEQQLAGIVSRMEQKGFEPGNLSRTLQPKVATQ